MRFACENRPPVGGEGASAARPWDVGRIGDPCLGTYIRRFILLIYLSAIRAVVIDDLPTESVVAAGSVPKCFSSRHAFTVSVQCIPIAFSFGMCGAKSLRILEMSGLRVVPRR